MNKIQLACVGVGTILAQLFGGWDMLLKTLVLIVGVDYVTGFLAGAYQGKLSSMVGYKGIIKKVSIFFVVLVACSLSRAFETDLLRNATIVFYISNEGLSVIENVLKTDVKIPEKLKQFLEALMKKKDGDDDA